MITSSQLTPIGVFNKTHGINGELSATFDPGIAPEDVRCLFVVIEGLPVPFFITGSRPRQADTWLVALEGVDTDVKAKPFVGKEFMALTAELPDYEDGDDEEGFYAADLIGFSVTDTVSGLLGTIVDINDQTENVLFVVERPDGSELLIPVVDEFIDLVDPDTRTLSVTLPDEMINLN